MKNNGITDIYPSVAVAEQTENLSAESPVAIGRVLKSLRTEHNLTLEDASKKTGVAKSTLSKIENEQISPTFTILQKLASGLGIEIPQLFVAPKKPLTTGRRDITENHQGQSHLTTTYEHELLAVQLSGKKMMPYKSRVHARSFDDFGEWVRHDGEEFLIVLEGEIQLLTEFYKPRKLSTGDSAYYDANMGHLVISTSDEDALILWITTA
ncbi:XRE family transcriptional regulator [Parashewanella spongiae]|uniref:XRE family transcriptional regulator n=1 Tax=Parashewanella spongiae TaxID=342950 RepID=A0A3A6U8I3_9GAMM|nr:XRE family transcriptional regulator [Parashewanella spongiae]MCL1078639.1 XRE family transcriptional regulator [Parashewanella spongiae]RJY12968.1 XRE family transcriptional regulator [Parashewanella spongiae]